MKNFFIRFFFQENFFNKKKYFQKFFQIILQKLKKTWNPFISKEKDLSWKFDWVNSWKNLMLIKITFWRNLLSILFSWFLNNIQSNLKVLSYFQVQNLHLQKNPFLFNNSKLCLLLFFNKNILLRKTKYNDVVNKNF